MTPNRNFQQFGPWIPYPRPIPVPTANIFDEPTQSICVNEEWIPYLTGAMKILMKEQTWDSSDDAVLSELEAQVTAAIHSWDDCSPALIVPDWYFINVVSEGITWAEIKFPTPFSSTELYNYVGYSCLVISDELPVVPVDFTVYCRSYVGGLDVGVKVNDFRIATAETDGAFHLAITDCLDNLTTVDDFGSTDYHTVFPLDSFKEIKSIEVTTDGVGVFFAVKGFDTWQCGPA